MPDHHFHFHFHHGSGNAPPWAAELKALMIDVRTHMATDAQLNTLKADIAALITEATTDMLKALAAAQQQSPDPAIDTLDAQIKQTIATLQAEAATIGVPVTTPPPTPPA